MVATLTDENFSNMAHLMVHLFITKSLSLSVLKASILTKSFGVFHRSSYRPPY